MTGRIPCLNPRCRRTADAAKHPAGSEIICGKCWRNVPRQHRDRYTELKRRDRKMERLIAKRLARGTIEPEVVKGLREIGRNARRSNWTDIRNYFLTPQMPVGLEGFLQEMRL